MIDSTKNINISQNHEGPYGLTADLFIVILVVLDELGTGVGLFLSPPILKLLLPYGGKLF